MVGADAEALSGAELCVGDGWIGLRSHPAPTATVNYGGPELPAWLDDALKALVQEREGIFWLVETMPNVRRTVRDASSIILFELCRTLDESPV